MCDVVTADPSFQALFDELSAAWARVRSVRAAIAAVSDIVLLPSPLLARYQAEEPLGTDVCVPGPSDGQVPNLVPVAVDWALVNEWRDAASRLQDSADAELPAARR